MKTQRFREKGASARQISWWWDGLGTTAPDSMLQWVGNHTNIVSSVFMNCGPQMGWTSPSIPGVVGNLSSGCLDAIPKLGTLGVRAELWLGESDDIKLHHALFANAKLIGEQLNALGSAHNITGFNMDLEPSSSTHADAANYAAFLGVVRGLLNRNSIRLTADVAGWCPMTADFPTIAASVDRINYMTTYNAASLEQWEGYFVEAFNPTPIDKLGVGLGCWIDSQTNNTWSTTPESAEERMCRLMNASVVEIDMFRLLPEENWPEPFWIPQLEQYAKGMGCNLPPPPPPPACPKGFSPGGKPGCCQASWSSGCDETCARSECAAKGWVWQDTDPKHAPYECCPP